MRQGAHALLFITGVGLAVTTNAIASPAPIVIPASQDWDGNDGPWSSFALQVGTPPQNVKVLIGTSSTQTLVVVPEGCTSSDPLNCATLRGGAFLLNQSTTWENNTADLNTNLYKLGLENSLGYTGNGEYGFDTITLGWQGSGGPSLKNQTLAGIATKEFYLGLFGLTPRPSNFSGDGNGFDNPVPSFMQNLRNQSLIPSTSWAYTAGNRYRLEEVLGSLTLGGYDASKFIPNNVSWQFEERDIRDLTLPISSITMSSSNFTKSLLQTPISAFIDSTVPHIWLPLEVCTQFEKAFNLTWNNETQLYLLDEYQQANLLAMNASVTFTLQGLSGNVNIALPFAAFDLIADYPIIANATYYFPLKRATSIDQYTLGRAFLQEAYIIADYDRHNFSVSQCNWEPGQQQEIITIHPPSLTSSSQPASKAPLIGGIAAGMAVLLLGAYALTYFRIILPRRKRRQIAQEQKLSEKKTDDESEPGFMLKPELDTGPVRAELDYNPGGLEADGEAVHELAEKANLVALVEIDSAALEVHELEANEQVAAELEQEYKALEMGCE